MADRWVDEVHGAPAPPGAAGLPAVQLCDQGLQVAALGQVVAVRAVGAVDVVVPPQVGADAHGDGLLADVEVHRAADHALAGEVVHGAGEEVIGAPGFAGSLAFSFCPAITAARIIERAKSNAPLSEALDALGVADSHGNYSTRLLGWQLRHAKGRIVGGQRLEIEKSSQSRANAWKLKTCSSGGSGGFFVPEAKQESVEGKWVERTTTTTTTTQLDALEAAEERAAIVEADEVQP